MEIRETSAVDLENIMSLWNDGNVMKYVGFPNGIGVDMKYLIKWLKWVINKPSRCHYSIYNEGVYCGETFYNVDENGYASMDIKLSSESRQMGLGTAALTYAINIAFEEGGAKVVYVDPNTENLAALKLYEKLGFVEKSVPDGIKADDTYREIRVEDWVKKEL